MHTRSKPEGIEHSCTSVAFQAFALPERANAALSGVLTAYEGVKQSFGSCSFFGFIPGDVFDIVDADEPVEELEEGVAEDLLGIEGSGLDELAAKVRAMSLVGWHRRASLGLRRNDCCLGPEREREREREKERSDPAVVCEAPKHTLFNQYLLSPDSPFHRKREFSNRFRTPRYRGRNDQRTRYPRDAQVADTRDNIFQMRDARYGFVWPTMILCLVLIAAYLFTAVREYRRSRAPADNDNDNDGDGDGDGSPGRWKSCGGDRRGRCFRVCTLVLALMVWMTAAGALTLSGEHLKNGHERFVLFFFGGKSERTDGQDAIPLPCKRASIACMSADLLKKPRSHACEVGVFFLPCRSRPSDQFEIASTAPRKGR